MNIKSDMLIEQNQVRFTYKSSEGVVVMDSSGKILFANSYIEELLGYSEGEMKGKFCFDTCPGHDQSGNRYCFSNCSVLEMAKRDELVQNFDIQVINRKGKKIWLNVTTLLESDSTFPIGSNIVHIFRESTIPDGMKNYFKQSVKDLLEASLRDKEENQTLQKGSRWDTLAKKYFLSPREVEVFQNLVQGHGTLEIAEVLGLSPTTVRTHVQRILKKLHVHSMLEAVALALGERPASS